jgi:GT2 family glycosyltransferase
MQQAGRSVVFVPDAEIVHVGRTHSIRTVDKSQQSLVRHFVNRYYFFHKHRPRLECLLLRPVMVLAMVPDDAMPSSICEGQLRSLAGPPARLRPRPATQLLGPTVRNAWNL